MEAETETGETDENGEPIYETTTETEEITLWSVSYTHLDVYKRQVF